MLHHQSETVCLDGGIEITLSKLQEIYLDWVNNYNFFDVEGFAGYYSVTVEEALIIIQAGHKVQKLYAGMLKELQSLVLN